MVIHDVFYTSTIYSLTMTIIRYSRRTKTIPITVCCFTIKSFITKKCFLYFISKNYNNRKRVHRMYNNDKLNKNMILHGFY